MSRRDDPTPALWREDYGGVLRPAGEPVPAPDPPARHDGPTTSRAAARSMRTTAPTIHERVRRYIAERGPAGATRQEVAIALDLPINTATPRVRELIQAGAIRETDRTRPTTSGCQAAVLVASEVVGDG